VREFMTTKLQTIRPQAAIEGLWPVFDAGHVAIVADDEGFYGLITRVDVVSYLRRKHQPL
jgi:cystathionine beta-synthase